MTPRAHSKTVVREKPEILTRAAGNCSRWRSPPLQKPSRRVVSSSAVLLAHQHRLLPRGGGHGWRLLLTFSHLVLPPRSAALKQKAGLLTSSHEPGINSALPFRSLWCPRVWFAPPCALPSSDTLAGVEWRFSLWVTYGSSGPRPNPRRPGSAPPGPWQSVPFWTPCSPPFQPYRLALAGRPSWRGDCWPDLAASSQNSSILTLISA